ncbi:leucine-rich repeat-containing protein 31 isoform X1 [Astyanax mexicanus]|uniref:leucine-rich repeat-containing protein 31 isoform X1 n=1 Tax=Astyanax mexicanus TaxID=7994 RepID=UPI0020CB02E2|nr:leucine-rich repeat-containing protein 31 isoform X1 [Astyanax mexicanus]
MESAEQQKARDGPQKRSPLDLIMNQIRRKTSFTERKKPTMGRLFRPSVSSDKNSDIPETKESESSEGKDSAGPGTESSDADSEIGSVVGWGRVKQFVQKLGKTPDTQSLSLTHCDLTATDVVELGTLLPFLAQLEVMDLSWNDLLGGSLKALTVHLQHVSKLKVLKVSSCRLTAHDLIALGEGLYCIPLLEMLDLSWNAGVGGGNLHCLANHLPSASSLRELHLVDCQLSEADAVTLGEALPLLPCLELLDLSGNKPMKEGLQIVVSALSYTPQLKTLKLSTCGLNKMSLIMLGEKLKLLPGLEHLDLSCNKESGGGFSTMTASLTLLTHLKCLDMHLCCLTEEDILALVQAIPSLSELTELDLSSNKSIGCMLQFLLPALPLSKMKKLHLNNCGLSLDTCWALATTMQSLAQLESLNLSWNKSVGEILQQLLEPLQTGCKLQELRLSSCDLTTEGMLHIESACKRGALSQLKLLDLSYNGSVGDCGWVSFYSGAAGLKELQELDVSLRPSASLSASPWLPALLDALPQLPSIRRLALQRWAFSSGEREKLDKALSKRNVVLECDKVAATEAKVAA